MAWSGYIQIVYQRPKHSPVVSIRGHLRSFHYRRPSPRPPVVGWADVRSRKFYPACYTLFSWTCQGKRRRSNTRTFCSLHYNTIYFCSEMVVSVSNFLSFSRTLAIPGNYISWKCLGHFYKNSPNLIKRLCFTRISCKGRLKFTKQLIMS